jgi:hypothetical protein
LDVPAEVGGNILGQFKLDIFNPLGPTFAIVHDLLDALRDLRSATGQDRGRRGQVIVR